MKAVTQDVWVPFAWDRLCTVQEYTGHIRQTLSHIDTLVQPLRAVATCSSAAGGFMPGGMWEQATSSLQSLVRHKKSLDYTRHTRESMLEMVWTASRQQTTALASELFSFLIEESFLVYKAVHEASTVFNQNSFACKA
mmetsp:Transcript_26062/g.36991  ORF Transcript_26062/g.36991 Transcript_26062/m.36991 type:complete len:138 (-) Transcript_26062:19-432(-)